MLNKAKRKTRFDYDNPETCVLALTYILETKKCPECLHEVSIESVVVNNDLLFTMVECSNCKFQFEHGTFLDDSKEANEVRAEHNNIVVLEA